MNAFCWKESVPVMGVVSPICVCILRLQDVRAEGAREIT